MIAIEISAFGGPEVLKATERSQPSLREHEILIRVEAAGVSRPDAMQRQGHYPPPPGASDIPGLEVAGTVAAIGAGVQEFKAGDPVCALMSGGGYAEFCAAPAALVLPIPEGWTAAEAATLPENVFTVYDNLITRAGLKSGETVLAHGGTSGIGSTAIMMSRAWGASAIATAGSKAKCDACFELGAEHAINYKESDFVREVKRITGGRGVDVVVDLIGGPYLDRNLESLALEGRISIIAIQGGRKAQLDILKLMTKRGRISGSTMRARTWQEKGEIAKAVRRDVWPLLPAKNPIRPVIDSIFQLTEAWRAHERLESGEHIGKIVLVT
jgi:NADPH:quinone reductase